MIASQSEIKRRIEELRLSYDGFNRQLARPGTSRERQERLQIEVQMLGEEISTLEKIAQVQRVERDEERVEAIVRDRLGVLAERYAADPTLPALELDELGSVSGEARALLWALGQDRLTLAMQEIMHNAPGPDPTRTERALPNILLHSLQEAPDPDSRASAAYELGKLRIREAIPALVQALNDRDPFVAQVAFQALANFPEEDLKEAQVHPDIVARLHDRS